MRKFTDKPLEQEVINKILKAGHIAPMGRNYQPQRILVMGYPAPDAIPNERHTVYRPIKETVCYNEF